MQPAFHRAQIARYRGTMQDVAVPRTSMWPDGGTLALDRELRSITLTVLTRTLLSSDIGGEAMTLVIAGSETTGNTIAWACYLIAQHPPIQERLQQEADLVRAGGEASYETLTRLPFTRAVITEALRLYSPVWILPRRALADVELGGHLLRAGSRMVFSPYALNRDPRLHQDPERSRSRPVGHRRRQDRYAGILFPVRARHQELHRRGIRLDRIPAPAQLDRRPLAPPARRQRLRAPRSQQHPGPERTPHHPDPPRVTARATPSSTPRPTSVTPTSSLPSARRERWQTVERAASATPRG
jgi:hypothetical protein